MMLDLNRLEAGRVTLSAEPFRIGHLLSSLRDGLPSGWRKPVVALEWETNDTNAVMDNDRAKVEMILRNLIHNALKFTDQGKVRVTAEVRANGRVRFAVEDTGPGIPAEELPNLFGMFHQGGAAPARGGAGLGLHIVRRFTELLGGEVQVESQPGEGTRFVVDLPLRLEQRV
jgi:signal transduction histidine kinase